MIPFFRTLFFFVVFWAHQLLILPFLLLFWLRNRGKDPFHHVHSIHWVTSTWGKLVCGLGGVHRTLIDHSGLGPEETALYVSNHQGDFDIPVLLASIPRPLGFVAKKELAHIPLVSQWMRVMGCVFLDREDRRKQVDQIRQSVRYLQGGISMVIFPEGTRSRSPKMGPFAKGSLQVGLRAGVPIVPVSLIDTYTLFPRGAKCFPGGRCRIHLHPAIRPETLTAETRQTVQEFVRDTIQQGLATTPGDLTSYDESRQEPSP